MIRSQVVSQDAYCFHLVLKCILDVSPVTISLWISSRHSVWIVLTKQTNWKDKERSYNFWSQSVVFEQNWSFWCIFSQHVPCIGLVGSLLWLFEHIQHLHYKSNPVKVWVPLEVGKSGLKHFRPCLHRYLASSACDRINENCHCTITKKSWVIPQRCIYNQSPVWLYVCKKVWAVFVNARMHDRS